MPAVLPLFLIPRERLLLLNKPPVLKTGSYILANLLSGRKISVRTQGIMSYKKWCAHLY